MGDHGKQSARALALTIGLALVCGPNAAAGAEEAASGEATEPAPESAESEPATAPSPEKKRVGTKLSVLVLPLIAERIDPALARVVDGLLAAELTSRVDLRVTTIADLNAILQAEAAKDLLGCDDVSCAAEIGGAVGADRILAGSIGRLGEEFVLTLRWLDAIYNEPLAHASRVISGGEAALPQATRALLTKLLDDSGMIDKVDRYRKRRPTFYTLELSVTPGLPGPAAEPYTYGIGGTVRLAWGGRPSWTKTLFYAVGGASIDYYAGHHKGDIGRISYGRLQIAPIFEARAAVPVANRNRTRLYGGVGLGLNIERFSGKQAGGLTPSGTTVSPEFRFVAGVWHRWNRTSSFFAGYRLRLMVRGAGVDSISELVEPASTRSTFITHAIELGWAAHF